MKRLILVAFAALPFIANAQEKPLNENQVKKENAATAVEEKKVAQEKSEAEIALEQGKEIVVKDTATVYSAQSLAENSGFARTVGFDGMWKADLNLGKNELVVTGGTLNNLEDKTSNRLMLTVYYANKMFDVKQPNMIGEPFGQIEIDPIEAKGKKVGQSYIIPLALETPPASGKYYPYIVLGSQDPQTKEFSIIDVKVFGEFVTLP